MYYNIYNRTEGAHFEVLYIIYHILYVCVFVNKILFSVGGSRSWFGSFDKAEESLGTKGMAGRLAGRVS